MATKVIVSKEKLDNLANAINTKAETSGAKTLDELILEVDNFQGGIDTTDATATSGDILLGKTAYVNEVKVEGTIETYDGSNEGGTFIETNVVKQILEQANVDNDWQYLLAGKKTWLVEQLNNLNLENISIGNIKLENATDYAFKNSVFETLPPIVLKSNYTKVYGGTAYYSSNYNYVFDGCSKLKELDVTLYARQRWDDYVTKLTAKDCFKNCKELTKIKLSIVDVEDSGGKELLYHSRFINMEYMFYGCEKLETIEGDIYVSQSDDPTKCFSYTFHYCTNLKNVSFKQIIMSNKSYPLTLGSGTSWGHLLTIESLVSACSALQTNGKGKLVVGTANLEKLANVYVKIVDTSDTNYYPCVICESTDEGAMLVSDYMTYKNCTLA